MTQKEWEDPLPYATEPKNAYAARKVCVLLYHFVQNWSELTRIKIIPFDYNGIMRRVNKFYEN